MELVTSLLRRRIRSWALCAAAFVLLATQAPLRAQQTVTVPFDADWVKPFPPFRLIGNIYWVGTWDLATYLITTPQGHILINSGLKETVPEIIQGIKTLGFKPEDVKLLLATHAHFDHVAGLAALQRLTKAPIAMSQADAELFESGGTSDFLFGKSPGAHYEAARVDRILKDGDAISMGGTELTVHLHPGHTKGATSFTTTIEENGKRYRVGIINLASINDGVNRFRNAAISGHRGRLSEDIASPTVLGVGCVVYLACGAIRLTSQVPAGRRLRSSPLCRSGRIPRSRRAHGSGLPRRASTRAKAVAYRGGSSHQPRAPRSTSW